MTFYRKLGFFLNFVLFCCFLIFISIHYIMPSMKCVLVGDGLVGKTCLLMSHNKNTFVRDTNKRCDNYQAHVKINDVYTELCLWDTDGQEDYDRTRPLSYQNTDVFLMCFSVDSERSFQNIQQRWYPEIRQHCPKTPFLLVGTKLDIRDRSTTCIKAGIGNKTSTFVSHSQGQTLANKLNAVRYIECSSQIIEGIHEVFVEAAKVGLYMTENQKGSRSVCNIV